MENETLLGPSSQAHSRGSVSIILRSRNALKEAEPGTKQCGTGSPVLGVATLIYLLFLALTSRGSTQVL